jgi:hypothetical protein
MARRGIKLAEPPSQDINYAALSEVEAFAEELPEKFLHCREMNHNWRPFTVGRYKDGGFERVLRCVRCRTKKVQHLDASGMILGGSKYEHPEGYLHKGMGRIVGEGRGLLRLESIKRIGLTEGAGA